MSLPDGMITKVTNLLSPDYPDNFERQAEVLNNVHSGEADYYEVDAAGLRQWFGSICVHAWSNDGTKLAFSGEIDGPSWDLYTYDLRSHSVTRMSDGPENVVWISWSPQDEYILHWSAYDVCEGGCERWWVAPSNGAAVRELDSPGNSGMGWASKTEYMVYTGANGLGRGYIYTLDVETNAATSVWPHQFDAYVTDPKTGIVGVGVEPWEEDFPPGFYLYDPRTGATTLVIEGCCGWSVDLWGNGEFSFFVTSDMTGDTAVRPDGTTITLEGGPRWAYVSPDRQSIAFRAAYTGPGIELYSPDGRITIVSSDTARHMTWRPDSAGFYYFTESALYYVPLSDPRPILMDAGTVDPYDAPPTWIP